MTTSSRMFNALWWSVTLAMIALSLMPLRGPQPGPEGSDKGVHVIGYALIAGLALRNRPRWTAVVGVVIFSLALGLTLELAQRAIPGRSCDVRDLIANAAGICLGVTAAYLRPHRGTNHGRVSEPIH